MRKVNDIMINQKTSDAGGGVFGPTPGFGPVPDGKYIPDIPEKLFREGRYHSELKGLIIGNMALEVRPVPLLILLNGPLIGAGQRHIPRHGPPRVLSDNGSPDLSECLERNSHRNPVSLSLGLKSCQAGLGLDNRHHICLQCLQPRPCLPFASIPVHHVDSSGSPWLRPFL